jgi:hypothetical protein
MSYPRFEPSTFQIKVTYAFLMCACAHVRSTPIHVILHLSTATVGKSAQHFANLCNEWRLPRARPSFAPAQQQDNRTWWPVVPAPRQREVPVDKLDTSATLPQFQGGPTQNNSYFGGWGEQAVGSIWFPNCWIFGLCPSSDILKTTEQRFDNRICFRSQVRGRHLFRWVP